MELEGIDRLEFGMEAACRQGSLKENLRQANKRRSAASEGESRTSSCFAMWGLLGLPSLIVLKTVNEDLHDLYVVAAAGIVVWIAKVSLGKLLPLRSFAGRTMKAKRSGKRLDGFKVIHFNAAGFHVPSPPKEST